MSLCLHTRLSSDAPSCPVCRHVPVEMMRPSRKVRRPLLSQLVGIADDATRDELIEAFGSQSDDAEDVDDVDVEVINRAWRNYLGRRRRFLRNNPRLLRVATDLQGVQRDMRHHVADMQRVFNRKCRLMWKVDDEMLIMRRRLRNLRRKEIRLQRTMHDEVDLVVQ